MDSVQFEQLYGLIYCMSLAGLLALGAIKGGQ